MIARGVVCSVLFLLTAAVGGEPSPQAERDFLLAKIRETQAVLNTPLKVSVMHVDHVLFKAMKPDLQSAEETYGAPPLWSKTLYSKVEADGKKFSYAERTDFDVKNGDGTGHLNEDKYLWQGAETKTLRRNMANRQVPKPGQQPYPEYTGKILPGKDITFSDVTSPKEMFKQPIDCVALNTMLEDPVTQLETVSKSGNMTTYRVALTEADGTVNEVLIESDGDTVLPVQWHKLLEGTSERKLTVLEAAYRDIGGTRVRIPLRAKDEYASISFPYFVKTYIVQEFSELPALNPADYDFTYPSGAVVWNEVLDTRQVVGKAKKLVLWAAGGSVLGLLLLIGTIYRFSSKKSALCSTEC